MAGAELETSTELDDAQIGIASRRGFRRSLSLFDLDIEGLEGKKKKSEYEENLEKEAREWQELLKSKLSRITELDQQTITIDNTILSKEQSAYIEGSPDFSKVIAESNSFCDAALDFLVLTENTVEGLLALEESSKWILDHKAFDVMYHCLYSNKEF